MRRGVFFIENNAEKFFLHMNTLLDIPKYEWYVDDVELNYIHFPSGKYSGLEFQSMLSELTSLSFARIRRYPIGTSIKDIDSYEEYVASNCDLMILFYDGGEYEIFAKENELLQKIFDFCMDHGFEDVAYIGNADNERSYMHF